MRVVVIGAGIAGLGTALALGRDGHDVVVVEKDAPPPPERVEDAFDGWRRRGTPQARLAHGFVPRTRAILAERAPDVLAGLLAAGARELDFARLIPPPARVPEDAELVALACRRAPFEWVLRHAALTTPGVSLVAEA